MFRLTTPVAVLAMLMSTAQGVTIETVPVGNPGNAGELSGASVPGGYGPDRICGAVDYAYNIGKYEVTAGQYVEFLNDVDPDGTNSDGLYNSLMVSDSRGCQITWNGSGYDFSGAPSGTAPDWENRPVNYVSWYDAAMFANWLTSGNIHQGAYDTSLAAGWGDGNAGNYTGITPHHSTAMDALVATYGEVWVIPTEDEWYKAAYHKNDGDTGNYFDYPTSSDTAPGYVDDDGELSGTNTAFIDEVTDPGNYATYNGDVGTWGIGPDYYRTEVGEWEKSDSPYGTFDQGGNLWEWDETLIGSSRGLRGGSLEWSAFNLQASDRRNSWPTHDASSFGFRVASIPEPSTLVLLGVALAGLFAYVWRRRRIKTPISVLVPLFDVWVVFHHNPLLSKESVKCIAQQVVR